MTEFPEACPFGFAVAIYRQDDIHGSGSCANNMHKANVHASHSAVADCASQGHFSARHYVEERPLMQISWTPSDHRGMCF